MQKTIVTLEIAGALVDGPVDFARVSEIVEKIISTLQTREVQLSSYSKSEQPTLGHVYKDPIEISRDGIQEFNLIM